MIIFGWGKQTIKRIGVAFENLCDHCHNEEYWILLRITTWFTLFFIPIIPYSIKYFLSCPVCKYGLALDAAQAKKIRPLAEANQLLIDGKITEEEYASRRRQMANSDIKQVEASPAKEEPLRSGGTSDDNGISGPYCAQCGVQIADGVIFCGNCGTKTDNK